MKNDRFSDTTELPVPRRREVPEYPDPFAEVPRQQNTYDTQPANPAQHRAEPGAGAPRKYLNGAASPQHHPDDFGEMPQRPQNEAENSAYHPQYDTERSGYYSQNPQHRTEDSGYRPQNPQRRTEDSGYRPQNPQRRTEGSGYRPQNPQRRTEDSGYRPQNPQRRTEGSGYRPQNPQRRTEGSGYRPQPHAQIRRASYREQMPEGGQTMPYRQPPQYRPPEFEEQIPDAPPKKKKRRKHRRHSCLRRIIASVVTLCVVLFALYSGVVLLAVRHLNYEETAPRAITATAAEQDADIRNILLIGTDNREDERGRADTVILLSFSKHNHTVTMTSLMRDSYVSIPNHGTDKLNAAYAYGGATLLMDTIVNNFGIPVDDYICVNFKAFVHIADAIGGIKVEISDREAEAINVILQSEVNQIMGDDPMDDFLPSGGTFLLNGKQALSYARIRHVGNADFERTERQRTVLNLMLNKLKHVSPTAIPKILTKAVPELKTNMNTGQLYLLSLQTPVKLIGYEMQKLRLPADGTYSDQTAPDGQMVLAVDFDANRQLYLSTVHDAPQPEQAEGEVTVP